MAVRSSFARPALFVINIFVLLGGMAILGIGAWIVSELNSYEREAPGQMFVYNVAVAAVIVGVFVAVVGISGCYGACKENVFCLKLYVMMLSLMIILELVLGAFSVVISDKIEEKLEEKLMQGVMGYNYNSNATLKVDQMQFGLHCCGALGPSDYVANANVSATMYDVPATCCKTGTECTMMAESDTIYQTGCVERMVKYAEDYLGPLVGVCFTVIVCQIISLVFAFCLIRSIRDEPKV